MRDGTQHTRHVVAQLNKSGTLVPPDANSPQRSWARCWSDYGLVPDERCVVPRVEERQVAAELDRLGERARLAQEEMDHIDSIVRSSGYSVTLANEACMIVAARNVRFATPACDARPGTIWTERFGGTNAIGTSIHEQRPTSLRREDHFFVDHLQETCISIPLVAPDCSVWASMGLSTCDVDLDRDAHVLTLNVLAASAERLSQEIFRREFAQSCVLKMWRPNRAKPLLLAIDPDGYIVGADRSARQTLSIAADQLGTLRWRDRLVGEDRMLAATVDDPAGPFELGMTSDGSKLRCSAIPAFRRPQPRAVAAQAIRPVAAGPLADRAITMDRWSGTDPFLRSEVATLRRLAGKRLPILLLGETGVGKDTLARAFHAESPRAGKPFVAVNCAAIPEMLIESELFGYEGGAFTGARKTGSPGRFREAHGGTLLLDEIGDMPVMLQTRLLRVLETGEFYPLSSAKPERVDVQVIAATNCDLEARVAAGSFRIDLYYRLAGIVITIPSLCERQDAAALIDGMADEMARSHGLRVSPAARAALHAHRWPGNLRELALVLERAASLASASVIEPGDLRLHARPASASTRSAAPAADPSSPSLPGDRTAIAAAEREMLEGALRRSGGDVEVLMQALGVSRATLYRRLKQHGLSRGRGHAYAGS